MTTPTLISSCAAAVADIPARASAPAPSIVEKSRFTFFPSLVGPSLIKARGCLPSGSFPPGQHGDQDDRALQELLIVGLDVEEVEHVVDHGERKHADEHAEHR